MELPLIQSIVLLIALEATGTRLHCLPFQKRLRTAHRNPKHVQLVRCCGDLPYLSTTHKCCHDDTIAEICQEWTTWTAWSDCSATCGGGDRFRNRVCAKGKGCPLDGVQVEKCGQEKCPEEFVECHACSMTPSNEGCNNLRETCRVKDGEGCQNIVRRENERIYVEKRCKQLQACHTEARIQVMQGVCDPTKDISLCLYCCEGKDCNRPLNWQQPIWYGEPWNEWLSRLVTYSQLIQNGKGDTPELKTFESFVRSNKTWIQSDEPQIIRQESSSIAETRKISDVELDALFIGAILDVERFYIQDNPVNTLLATLYERLPRDYPIPKGLEGFASMR